TVTLDGKDYVAEVKGDGNVNVTVNGKTYAANVAEGGDASAPASTVSAGSGEVVAAPLTGNIFKILVGEGDSVEEGETIIVLEAMKMETEVKAQKSGTVSRVCVKEGDSVTTGDTLLEL
ncbi:MAG: biotin/lipoyl-containing protein, partial [Natronospirillum sp.]